MAGEKVYIYAEFCKPLQGLHVDEEKSKLVVVVNDQSVKIHDSLDADSNYIKVDLDDSQYDVLETVIDGTDIWYRLDLGQDLEGWIIGTNLRERLIIKEEFKESNVEEEDYSELELKYKYMMQNAMDYVPSGDTLIVECNIAGHRFETHLLIPEFTMPPTYEENGRRLSYYLELDTDIQKIDSEDDLYVFNIYVLMSSGGYAFDSKILTSLGGYTLIIKSKDGESTIQQIEEIVRYDDKNYQPLMFDYPGTLNKWRTMRVGDLETHFNKPLQVENMYIKESGMTFFILGGTNIKSITVESDIKTNKGIGVGDTREAVVAAIGIPDRLTENESVYIYYMDHPIRDGKDVDFIYKITFENDKVIQYEFFKH